MSSEYTFGMEAVRQTPYELAVSLPGGGLELLYAGIRARGTVNDVRRNRAREQDQNLGE